jgi:hypothetical protein
MAVQRPLDEEKSVSGDNTGLRVCELPSLSVAMAREEGEHVSTVQSRERVNVISVFQLDEEQYSTKRCNQRK